MTDLPPPVTSDVTLDDVEAYLDRLIQERVTDWDVDEDVWFDSSI